MKRLFISLFAGVMFPAVVFFVVAFTSKLLLGPRPIPKFLIYFLAWPFLNPVRQVWCRILPVPDSSVSILLIGYFIDAALAALLVFVIITIIRRNRSRRLRLTPPPFPPILNA